ncbi:MAG: hypothetical protein A3I38_02195 [Candidatus Wildermuthbacteria bacterium RIFCSPLOWO2_02_FULL_47_10]|uniref:Glycosyltransferase 2-like domain-containing protein n=1 Tax=Candidatus Wildermuthbacteria bacterium RIFCSPHIGHO2_02_FULL_47_17 TaxID=1802452 RepID=A0A1G2R8B9_9BACT|nr:MAG: hypothetical protein A3D59_02060 [Candidatus Wildermuthbacteria bacterium RIFCSPHIGHO2_02_FULL_47_17]OHA75675.1 MAG: hypothetical protein A3I38_02195 [Candidatus Wildermuthbacteria bacterium RIFCSPLOWO2_02_FULL_47_10]
MKTAKIIVHCLVQNEGRFIWYAINSVLPFVDRIMVWDTGSTDETVQIVRLIESPKIKIKELSSVDPEGFTKVSQQMIEKTPQEYNWILILDGDEIWPEKSIKTITEYARSHSKTESIVVRTNNLVGDIYHRLPESAGKYRLAGQKGHLALRLINKNTIPGLHFDLPHGRRGLFDNQGQLIQDRDPEKIKFLNLYYHHATHLPRSLSKGGDAIVPKRKQKIKYELGEKIPKDQIPEIFFAKDRPELVPDMTKPAPLSFWIISALQTIPRRIKRLLIKGKDGY